MPKVARALSSLLRLHRCLRSDGISRKREIERERERAISDWFLKKRIMKWFNWVNNYFMNIHIQKKVHLPDVFCQVLVHVQPNHLRVNQRFIAQRATQVIPATLLPAKRRWGQRHRKVIKSLSGSLLSPITFFSNINCMWTGWGWLWSGGSHRGEGGGKYKDNIRTVSNMICRWWRCNMMLWMLYCWCLLFSFCHE